MHRTGLLVGAIVACGFLSQDDMARGQEVGNRAISVGYSSQQPRLSPYLDLFRRQEGVLDNYNQFVRPKVNLQRTLNEQDRQLRRQGQQIRAINSAWSQAQRTGTMAPTGTGAAFFNYSHFYPGMRR